MSAAALLVGVLLSSLIPAVVVFLLPEAQRGLRTGVNVGGAVVKLGLVAAIAAALLRGEVLEARMPFLPGADLVLRADGLSVLFVALSGFLWLLTTLYAVGYLEDSPNRRRFFGFFNLCVASTMGIALAGNLVTFLVGYEILTLATYPLVAHRGTARARAAAARYLVYTLGGGLTVLLGTIWLHGLAGSTEFVPDGALAAGTAAPPVLRAIFWLLVAGMGVKAALVPLHGWLPEAMVAPAPVSALLHAVAVVKAGAFGIVRVVHDLFGLELASALGVLAPLAAWAAATIVWGSMRALVQTDLKRRLAYSTVSQVAFITLGVALAHPLAALGGIVHLVHQGLMKITLFFCAGNVAETLGLHEVDDLTGLGRRMPLTMLAFTVAAFGMIGVPPLAGFVSKWYLATGALASGSDWVLLVLVASTLLNAAYFLPIVSRAWLGEPALEGTSREAAPLLLVPTLVTAILVAAVGVLAWTPASPLQWTRFLLQGPGR